MRLDFEERAVVGAQISHKVNHFGAAYLGTTKALGIIVAIISLSNMIAQGWKIGLLPLLERIIDVYRLIFHFPFEILTKMGLHFPEIYRDPLILYSVLGAIILRIVTASVDTITRAESVDVRPLIDLDGNPYSWRFSETPKSISIYLPLPYRIIRLCFCVNGSISQIDWDILRERGHLDLDGNQKLRPSLLGTVILFVCWPYVALTLLSRPKILALAVSLQAPSVDIKCLAFLSDFDCRRVSSLVADDLIILDVRLIFALQLLGIAFGSLVFIGANFFAE